MEISIIRFCLGLLLVVVPLYVLHVFDTGLLRRACRSLAWMVASLVVLGLCLYFVFSLNHWVVNVAFVLLMVVVGAVSATSRARLSVSRFFVPVATGLLVAVLVVCCWLLFLVFGQKNPLEARFLVPVVGLLMGTMTRSNADALTIYYMGLRHHNQLYYHLTGNGASPGRALTWFVRRALQRVALPSLGRMATLMVTASPVVTWSLLLGGFSVVGAVALQMVLLVAGFCASVVSLLATLYVARRFSFDEYGRLLDFTKKQDVLDEDDRGGIENE